jgi:hypothetical protein
MQKTPIVEEVPAQDLRDAEDEMPVRHLLEHVGAQPFSEFHHPLLVAGGTKMSPFAAGRDAFLIAKSYPT